YGFPWRDLHRRANAESACFVKPEITPPSFSYHSRDSTPEETLPDKPAQGTGAVGALRHKEAADDEENKDAINTENIVPAEQAFERLVLLCSLGDQKGMRKDDGGRGDNPNKIEIRVVDLLVSGRQRRAGVPARRRHRDGGRGRVRRVRF